MSYRVFTALLPEYGVVVYAVTSVNCTTIKVQTAAPRAVADIQDGVIQGMSRVLSSNGLQRCSQGMAAGLLYGTVTSLQFGPSCFSTALLPMIKYG